MEEDLFTFTAYVGREPVYRDQGFPSYTATSTFKCMCKTSKVVVPHNAIATNAGLYWSCPMPTCRLGYTFRLEYPQHVLYGGASISDTLVRIEGAVASIHQLLREQQIDLGAIRRQDPMGGALVRRENPLDVIQRAMRQPDGETRLRQDLDEAFGKVEDQLADMQQALEGINDRADEAVQKAERTLRHVRTVEQTTSGADDTLQELQMEVGALNNLGVMIQQINPNESLGQIQGALYAIDQSLQQVHAAVHRGPPAAASAGVQRIEERLDKYNKRYDKSIGVIIG